MNVQINSNKTRANFKSQLSGISFHVQLFFTYKNTNKFVLDNSSDLINPCLNTHLNDHRFLFFEWYMYM